MIPLEVAWGGVAAVPLVIALVQMLKQVGLPARFAGLSSILLGLAGGAVFVPVANAADWRIGLIQGLWVGVGASGLYSSIKAVSPKS